MTASTAGVLCSGATAVSTALDKGVDGPAAELSGTIGAMPKAALWVIHARGSTWGVPDPAFPNDTIPAHSTLLLDMIAYIGTNRFVYIYDFDRLSHTIKIVNPMPAVPGIAYPLLIDAVGRCPLEDSAGPPGYTGMHEALRDPAHPRHAEVIEWPGRDFDPNDANRASSRRTWRPWRNG